MDTLIAIVIIAVAVWYVFVKKKIFGGKKRNGSCGCGGSCGSGSGSCQSGLEPFSCEKEEKAE